MQLRDRRVLRRLGWSRYLLKKDGHETHLHRLLGVHDRTVRRPYADHPVDFETVCSKLGELGFDGVELGGFAPHPNPDDYPDVGRRKELKHKMEERGLAFSGLAANLWAEHLCDTDDSSAYVAEFTKNCAFCVDLGIKGIRVDTVQPPTILGSTRYTISSCS